jgi:hypothetical protein
MSWLFSYLTRQCVMKLVGWLFFSLALQRHWALASDFFSFMIILQMVGLLGRVNSSSQVLYVNTGQHKHILNIHSLSGTRTHNPGLRASEDSTFLRPVFLNRRVLTLIIPGPHLIEKRIYRAAVWQRLRTTALDCSATVTGSRLVI